MGSFKLGGMTLKSLFGKPETILYPVQERYQPEGLKGHIAIDVDTCILCSMCQKACPTGAITVDKPGETWSIDRFRCVQCGACWRSCPKDSLEMLPTYPKPGTKKTSETFEVHPKKPERKPVPNQEEVSAKSAPMSIEEQRAAMEAKVATMDPEKAAKVRAAFEAKIAKQQAE